VIKLKGLTINVIIFTIIALASLIIFLLILNSILPNFLGKALCKVYNIILSFPLPKQLKPNIPGCSSFPSMERIFMHEGSEISSTLADYLLQCWDKSDKGRLGQTFICYELFVEEVSYPIDSNNFHLYLKDQGKIDWKIGLIQGEDLTIILKYNHETGKIEVI
jgi:hypothetical protein